MDTTVYELRLPEQWYPLPWEDAPQSIAHALRVVEEFAAGLPGGKRWNLVFVPRPDEGRVSALLSLRLRRVDENGLADYRAALESFGGSTDTVEVVQRSTSEARLPSGTAVITHDITIDRHQFGMQQPATERVGVALFVNGTEALAEFTLATQDLALYPDMVEAALVLVSGYVDAGVRA